MHASLSLHRLWLFNPRRLNSSARWPHAYYVNWEKKTIQMVLSGGARTLTAFVVTLIISTLLRTTFDQRDVAHALSQFFPAVRATIQIDPIVSAVNVFNGKQHSNMFNNAWTQWRVANIDFCHAFACFVCNLLNFYSFSGSRLTNCVSILVLPSSALQARADVFSDSHNLFKYSEIGFARLLWVHSERRLTLISALNLVVLVRCQVCVFAGVAKKRLKRLQIVFIP